ncbi:MAG: hypothetical protein M1837_005533 [Sclerophora amabilis]|nr:MAG: hypothetical protein M1837_005533 [Sclerophora amabilis]
MAHSLVEQTCISPPLDGQIRSPSDRKSAESRNAGLLQRFNAVARRIAGEEHLDESTCEALGKALDDIEKICPERRTPKDNVYESREISNSPNESTPFQYTGGEFAILDSGGGSNFNGGDILDRVSKVVEEFRCRFEELKHVHDMSILRTEKAAQRILQLESEVKQLESEISADESELTFLKLQLKALEIQAMRYIPTDDEEELTEGIRRWKLDWADLDHRFKTRRRTREGSPLLDEPRQSPK